jgi:hypothetical protein
VGRLVDWQIEDVVLELAAMEMEMAMAAVLPEIGQELELKE